MSFVNVELNRGNGPYISGENVFGKVYVNPSCLQVIFIKTIKISCIGRAETNLGLRYVNKSGLCQCKDEEELFHVVQCVFHDPAGNRQILFGPDHFYDFTIKLPFALPSSFKEILGRIHYFISVSIIFHGTEDLPELNPVPVQIPFVVQRRINLNTHPLALLSAELRDHKNVGIFPGSNNCTSLFNRGGPIGFRLQLKQRGYILGEPIPFTVDLMNNSNRVVSSVRCFVLQFIVFHGFTKYAIEKEKLNVKLCMKEGPGIVCGQNTSWNDFLVLPSNPDLLKTISINCGIMSVHHQFHIQLVGQSWIRRSEQVLLEGCIPLVIGEIPIERLGSVSNFSIPISGTSASIEEPSLIPFPHQQPLAQFNQFLVPEDDLYDDFLSIIRPYFIRSAGPSPNSSRGGGGSSNSTRGGTTNPLCYLLDDDHDPNDPPPGYTSNSEADEKSLPPPTYEEAKILQALQQAGTSRSNKN